MRWWLRTCPKCRGDCFEDLSGSLPDVKCLQCGRILTAAERQELGIRSPGQGNGHRYAVEEQKTRLAA